MFADIILQEKIEHSYSTFTETESNSSDFSDYTSYSDSTRLFKT